MKLCVCVCRKKSEVLEKVFEFEVENLCKQEFGIWVTWLCLTTKTALVKNR